MSADNGTENLPLRRRQAAATRAEIIDIAMELLPDDEKVSHESIAKRGAMSSRTVYRHFPDRTSLMLAVWQKLRETMRIRFPASEDEIIPLTRDAFAAMDANETLVNAVMASVAGARLLKIPGYEGRGAFQKSLQSRMTNLTSADQKRMVGSFVAIYSAPFWQLMRNRAELSAGEAQDATVWILDTLLKSLHSKTKKRKN